MINIPQNILRAPNIVKALIYYKIFSAAIFAVMHEIFTSVSGDPVELSKLHQSENYRVGSLQIISEKNCRKWERRGVVVLLQALEQKVWSSKPYRSTAGICQEGHPEFKVLRCSSKKSGVKVSV